jgi:hypothetical protein
MTPVSYRGYKAASANSILNIALLSKKVKQFLNCAEKYGVLKARPEV